MARHASERQSRKLFRRGRVLGMVLENLGLDVELDLTARAERKYLIECWHARAGHRGLFGEFRIAQRAPVPLAQFFQSQCPDRDRCSGTFADLWIQQRVMRDDQDVVLCDCHVQFEPAYSYPAAILSPPIPSLPPP